MNTGDKDDPQQQLEDAFYQADYEEDTIDYDLDSNKFLEDDDCFEPEASESSDQAVEFSHNPEPEQQAGPRGESGYELDQEEQWNDEDEEPAEEDYIDSWPLGLVAVGIIALLLLAAGGYGVLQQRTEMQEEIRQLQATLATTTSNTELSASRQAQRGLESHNNELQSQLELLQNKNKKLAEELSLVQSTPLASPPPEPVTPPSATAGNTGKQKTESSTPTKQAAKPKAVPKQPPPAPTAGNWFVNFGSYSQNEMADHWAAKLSVEKGRVVVMQGEKSGTQYFRVRVINLPNREIAGKIARQLEQTYSLPRLWVGEQ